MGFLEKIKRFFPRVLLTSLLAISFSACAEDTNRIERLEREIQALKQRLSRIEAQQTVAPAEPKAADTTEGWRSLSAWRELKTGMSPSKVREILGGPSRIDGGDIAFWHYPNRGSAVFMDEKLFQWTEPRQ